MKKSYLLITTLAVIKLVIQLLGNRNYGFHRDELLHLSVSEHLNWGFMEFPPFIGLVGKLSYLFFDYSLMGTRFFPTLAGVAILVLCCLMAKEFKGSFKAILLAGVCVLAFLPFYRNHTLFQPVAFDQLFWTFGFYFWIRFINTEDKNYLLLTGLALGAGLMNKYTIIIWAFGIFSGMLLSDQKSLLKDKWLYLSGLLALAIFLPNIIWQLDNGIPFIRHLQELNSSQLNEISWYDFGLQQLAFPITLIISIIGVTALIRGKTYRSVGVAAIIIFVTMWALKSKAYYVFALYPVLFAAGSAKVEAMLSARNPLWIYTSSAILFLSIVPFIPHLTPVLPIDQFIKYADIKAEAGRYELTGDYADMFGWEEQVALVDSVYRSLSDDERANCVLWAENYGEAGALTVLGKKYGLPNPISRHGSFWSWGYGNANASVWISLGNEQDAVEWIFNDVKLVKTIAHPYAIGEENGIPLYVCRSPKRDVAKWWKGYEPYIFD